MKVDPDNRQNRFSGIVTKRKMTDEERELYKDVGAYKKPSTFGKIILREDDKSMGKINKNRLVEILKEDGFTKAAYTKAAVEFQVTEHSVACYVSKTNIKKEFAEEFKGTKKVTYDEPEKVDSTITIINTDTNTDKSDTQILVNDEADILGKIKAIVSENKELKEKMSILKSALEESVDSVSQFKSMLDEIIVNID